MSKSVENEFGTIRISDEVISKIAGATVVECYGLVGMVSKGSTSFADILKRENLSKGVEIHVDGDSITIGLYVIIQFGTKISVVAENIINNVKYNVEKQTGLKVSKVNLNIEGVRVHA